MTEHQFFQDYGKGIIRWKILLKSPPEKVYSFLNTDEGRMKFWAETTLEKENNLVYFKWPGKYEETLEVLEKIPNKLFKITYLGGSIITFTLHLSPGGGTILELEDKGTELQWLHQVYAGWVSVLMTLKGAVDFEIDLRNHNNDFAWNQGFCDN